MSNSFNTFISQLLETVIGKNCCLKGELGDGTPYQDIDLDSISKSLETFGYEKTGYETMINGMTGKALSAHIFIGPTYYQRLKHMVQDKQHAISRGSLQNLVRQPIEGRSKNGGLRFGEIKIILVSVGMQIHC